MPANKKCTVDGCNSQYRNVGFCSAHYQIWRKYGDPLVSHKRIKSVCSMPNCGLPGHARELCERHYKRWQTHGDPHVVITDFRHGVKPRPSTELFWEKVTIAGPNNCWEWTGPIKAGGYGNHQWVENGVKCRAGAHRFSLMLHLGDAFVPGLLVCHHCDNPPCVNPAHLYLGTHTDNARDMVQRGRDRNQFSLAVK